MGILTKIQSFQRLRFERDLFALLESKGIPRKSIEEIPHNFADRPVEKGEIYYVFDGPLDEKTRPFCRKLLTLDKVVSQVDIDILTNYLGYDVFQYKGSYNCRHKWRRFRGKFILTPELTVGQIRDLVSKGIKAK